MLPSFQTEAGKNKAWKLLNITIMRLWTAFVR